MCIAYRRNNAGVKSFEVYYMRERERERGERDEEERERGEREREREREIREILLIHKYFETEVNCN